MRLEWTVRSLRNRRVFAMKPPRVRIGLRSSMIAVAVLALLMAWCYNWSERRYRCGEIASRHAAVGMEYRLNARGNLDMLRIAAWHDHMRQVFQNAAERPWEQIPTSRPVPPANWQP